jgi:hypothetical protein
MYCNVYTTQSVSKINGEYMRKGKGLKIFCLVMWGGCMIKNITGVFLLKLTQLYAFNKFFASQSAKLLEM